MRGRMDRTYNRLHNQPREWPRNENHGHPRLGGRRFLNAQAKSSKQRMGAHLGQPKGQQIGRCCGYE